MPLPEDAGACALGVRRCCERNSFFLHHKIFKIILVQTWIQYR
jgi:hypothetical protein